MPTGNHRDASAPDSACLRRGRRAGPSAFLPLSQRHRLDLGLAAHDRYAMTERLGFTASDWRAAPIFEGRCATSADVEEAVAVFALADTVNGRPVRMAKPSPVIWYAEDEQFAALVVQAEYHETDDDGALEFLGLLLPDGKTAVVFADDLDFVDDSDPVWQSLLEADSTEDEWISGL